MSEHNMIYREYMIPFLPLILSMLINTTIQNASLEARIRDLEALLDRERGEHEATMAANTAEIKRLRDALEEQMVEYRDLLGIKIQLDNEIATYRKLLEAEETRSVCVLTLF